MTDQAPGVPLLEARGLTKHFRVAASRLAPRGAVLRAVEDVSLALPTGGITAIVGESGSGKSTLAKMLGGLIKPTSGQVLLDGQRAPAGRAYARQVQLVLQDPFSSLNPVHGVRYHLARPLKVHRVARSGTALDQAVADLLTRVSLAPASLFIDKYPHELSGGQRQRVAIARALAVSPRVLLADEPVSMLDVSIRLGVLNLLADLRQASGLAIVYVTHDIASARYLADVISVMYAGQIIESGPSATVTDQPAHPYTQLLLSAAPDPDRISAGGSWPSGSGPSGSGVPPDDRAPDDTVTPRVSTAIAPRGRGAPPNLASPPAGCRFHPRCPHAMRICARVAPDPIEVAPGQVSACWLHATDVEPAERAPLKAEKGGVMVPKA